MSENNENIRHWCVNHRCDCVTAINDAGIEEMQFALAEYDNNFYVEYFDAYDAETIDEEIFDKFNDKFNLLIDWHEEETLPNKNLPRAKEILVDFLKGNITQVQRETAQKVLNVVNKGIESGADVWLEL